jgi:hypothetical protein
MILNEKESDDTSFMMHSNLKIYVVKSSNKGPDKPCL